MKYKGYRVDYSLEKDLLLKETRGIGFKQMERSIKAGLILDDIAHKKYPHQRVLVIKIKKYVYAVPYVHDKINKVMFLKTIYPSRKLTQNYLKGGNNEKNKS